jgi:hypothetical protein
VLKATIKKSGFAGYSVFSDFNFHCSDIIAYIFDVNSHDSRQSDTVFLSVFYALCSLNDEARGRKTEYKVSCFLECI